MDEQPVTTADGAARPPAHPGIRSIRREMVFLIAAIVLALVLSGLGLVFGPGRPVNGRGTMIDADAQRAAVHAPAQTHP